MGGLINIILEYAKKNPVRFHMPGHKGRQICFDSESCSNEYNVNYLNYLNYQNDITELFFTDNLYSPDSNAGLIEGLEKRISECFFENANNSGDIVSYISCGGATLGIQASVLSLVRNKNNRNNKNNKIINTSSDDLYIICDRVSHVSFINALSLLNVNPLWIYPGENFCDRIEYFAGNYKNIKNINSINNIIGVFVTSPDYFGSMRDITEISAVCKKYSLPLVVDNSHGSHLAFYKNGVMHPINCGADISIDSVHKTLPALTGAAIIHANGNYNNYGKISKIRDCMKIFASTSPSFLILQSVENMVDYLEKSGRRDHERLIYDIDLFRKKASDLNIIVESEFEFKFESGKSRFRDPYRIVLTFENAGKKLYYYLFKNNITCEFFDKDNVIIIPSILNKSDDFDLLLAFLENFVQINPVKPYKLKICNLFDFIVNRMQMSLSDALKMTGETVPVAKSINRIAAESVFAYPPGIPVVLPGEIIDENIYDIIKDMRNYIDVIM